jgi:hypothetical protein
MKTYYFDIDWNVASQAQIEASSFEEAGRILSRVIHETDDKGAYADYSQLSELPGYDLVADTTWSWDVRIRNVHGNHETEEEKVMSLHGPRAFQVREQDPFKPYKIIKESE